MKVQEIGEQELRFTPYEFKQAASSFQTFLHEYDFDYPRKK